MITIICWKIHCFPWYFYRTVTRREVVTRGAGWGEQREEGKRKAITIARQQKEGRGKDEEKGNKREKKEWDLNRENEKRK